MDLNDTETATLDGTLVFKPTKDSACDGCWVLGQYGRGKSVEAPPCSAGVRKDGRQGIWVQA